MSSNNEAATVTSPDEKGATGDAMVLFASKGSAAPAPAKGDRPSIFLIEDNAGGISGKDPGETVDDEESTAGKTGAKDGAGQEAGTIGTPLAPAASLDAEPFDPARKKRLLFEDYPELRVSDTVSEHKPGHEPGNAVSEITAGRPTAASTRPSLLTATLAAVAAAAAVVAVITVFNWYDFFKQPAPDSAVLADIPGETTTKPSPPRQATLPAVPVETTAVSAKPAPAESAAIFPVTPDFQRPTIDLVRLEPNSSAIIAGRAAPGAALIVLDNDNVIGSVIAGESGDWMLIPNRPLAGGEHEIALAIKADDGTVSVSTPQRPTQATPTPRPAPDASFVVQVASVNSEAGAEQEWEKLKASLPTVLGALEPHIDEAELRGRGTFHRIRLGPFSSREKARALCAALTSAGKGCLVVRR